MKRLISILLVMVCFLPHTVFAADETPAAYAVMTAEGFSGKNISILGGNVSETPAVTAKDDRRCWVLGTETTENSSLYLDFDESIAVSGKDNYRLDITYFDYARGRMLLKYRDAVGTVSLKPIYCAGSEVWKTTSVELFGMAVDNSMSSKYDLQVYTYDTDEWNTPAAPVYISAFELYPEGTVQSAAITFTTAGMDKNFNKGSQTIRYRLSNNMSSVKTFTPKHSAYDEDGNLLWTETAEASKIGVNSSKIYTVNMDIEKYGVHTLRVEVTDTDGGYTGNECDFAVLMNDAADKRNYDFGVSAHFSWEDRHIETMPLFEQMGAGFLRDEVLWEDYVNAGNAIPQRHQKYLDAAIAAGAEPLLIFGPTPYYSPEDFPKTDEELKSFSEYVYGLVSDTVGKVKYFEVWNEYNANVEPEVAYERGKEYAKLLRVAYDSAKLANPDCVILGPVAAGWSWEFADGMLAEDPKIAECIDIVSFHTYHRDKHTEDSAYLEGRRVCVEDMKASFGEDKEIWLTEFGWCEDDYGITEREDAMYTVRYLIWNDEAGLYDKMFRYDWINDQKAPGAYGRNFGFLNSDYSAKKVYLACDAMNEFLVDAVFDSKHIDSSNNYFYKYKVGDIKDITVVFNENDTEQTVLLEPTLEDNRLYDMYGNELPLVLKDGMYEVTVDGEPYYFVSADDGADMVYATNTAVIRGAIEGGQPGDPFMIYVMNPDKTKEDIVNPGGLYYVEYGTVGENGVYEFSFPMEADAGEYEVYVGYQRGKTAIGPATLSVKRDVVASTSLFAGDKKIAALEELGGAAETKLKVQGNIDNSYNARLSAMLFAAGYKNGTMLWANQVSGTPSVAGDNEMSFEIDKSIALEADEIKIFLWKDNQSPLAKQVTPIN